MKSYLPDIIASLLILLFVYAAMSKLMMYDTFRSQVKESPFIVWFSSIAWTVPVVELIVAALLFYKPTQIIGFYASAFLLLVFTIYIACMLGFAPHLPCSCGGVLKQLSWKQHLVFNGFFILIAISGILLKSKLKTKEALKS
ncbi:MAG: MauE/DoxX family redox-associated membrane protein [Ferruginibacter sp.]